MAGAWKKAVAALVVGYAAYCVYQALYAVPPVPDLPEVNYWGRGEPKPDDERIRPSRINISELTLEDLQRHLDLELRLQPSLEGVNFEYGFNSEELRRVVKFWREEYRWRDREALLNTLPQFVAKVFGLQVHFIHAKPQNVPDNVEVVPLLLVHGWPGSVREFYDLIPILTTVHKDRDFVFEVIAPSLPGFYFSEPAHKPGLNPAHIAVMLRQLMLRLGFSKFYTQGGDWGSLITTNLAILFPQNVLGMHLNMCAAMTPAGNLYLYAASLWPSLFVQDEQLASKLFPLDQFFSNLMLESGYMHIQATKPDTVGAVLNNSPVGLAAYILEKFSTWTDMAHRGLSDGGLTKKFTLPDLLDNVMMYWITGSITSSMRTYSECFNKKYFEEKWDQIPVHVPTFCARFPNELANQPNFILRLKYKNLISDREAAVNSPLFEAMRPPRGGHFAAFEEPQLVANSLLEAVKIFRSQ